MTGVSLTALDHQFRLGDHLRVVERDGHGVVVGTTAACAVEIALQGAQVLRWRPTGFADVLWCAPMPPAGAGKAIRGGVPVCWPWFGPHATDPTLPQHGLVRTAAWRLHAAAVALDGVHVTFQHEACGAALRLEVTAGEQLSIALTTHNLGAVPLTITEALHTYFMVADKNDIRVNGLDACTFRDKTDGGRVKTHLGAMQLATETDALFDVAPDRCEIDDLALGRRVGIVRQGGRSTVVWNPGAVGAKISDLPAGGERHFVCVESGNIGAAAVTVAPGAVHRLAVAYTVTAL